LWYFLPDSGRFPRTLILENHLSCVRARGRKGKGKKRLTERPGSTVNFPLAISPFRPFAFSPLQPLGALTLTESCGYFFLKIDFGIMAWTPLFPSTICVIRKSTAMLHKAYASSGDTPLVFEMN
jgi:hypothetical protein